MGPAKGGGYTSCRFLVVKNTLTFSKNLRPKRSLNARLGHSKGLKSFNYRSVALASSVSSFSSDYFTVENAHAILARACAPNSLIRIRRSASLEDAWESIVVGGEGGKSERSNDSFAPAPVASTAKERRLQALRADVAKLAAQSARVEERLQPLHAHRSGLAAAC